MLILRSPVDAAGRWSRPAEALGSVLWSRQLAPSHDAMLVWKAAKEIPNPATKYAGRSPVPCYPSSQSLSSTHPPEASLGAAAYLTNHLMAYSEATIYFAYKHAFGPGLVGRAHLCPTGHQLDGWA